MPLFQNQTNLAGQGKFAPSVNYYAGVRAPVPATPSLPKAEASFNIDLSSIGNAMIAAKESETRLGLAAVEMEQNLRNAERDRQLKIDLANLEQEGANARLDRELATRMDIAKLNNATELEKAMLKKSKEQKEDRLAEAEQDILNNEELQQAFLEYSAEPSKRELEYQAKRNRIVANTAAKYGVLASKLQTVVSNAGWSKGIGNNIEATNEINKKITNDQYEQDKALAQTINPGLYSQNPDAAVQQATGLKQRIAQVQSWQSMRELPGQSQHIKDWANEQINSNVGNIALDIAIASATAAQNELGTRTLDSPEVFLETTKQIATTEIASATGLGAGQIRPIIDGVYLTSGLTGTMQAIFADTGSNAQYKQKMLQYVKDTGELDILQNGPEFAKTALIIGNIPLFNSLDEADKKMYSQIVSSALFGRVTPYANESGKTGWTYSFRGREVSYSSEEINRIGKKLGLDVRKPDQIVAFVGSQILSNGGLKAGIANGTISQGDAYPIYVNTVRNNTGNTNSETGLEGFNLSAMEESQMRNNIVNCTENERCTPEDLMSDIDAFEKDTKEYNKALQIARGYEAEARLGKFFKTGSDEGAFNDAVNYIRHPSNIKGKDVATFFGKNYEDNPEKWDHYDLKNTKIYYSIENGKAVLKYYQDGWFKTGGTELQKRLDLVSNTLEAAGVPLEGQIAFYKNQLGDVLETNVKDASLWNKINTSLQEKVLDTAAKADTEFLSWLSKDDEDVLSNASADDYAFGAGFALGDRPDLENKMWEKLDQLGKEDYGLLKQGFYGLASLLAFGIGTVLGSMGEASGQWMNSAVEGVLEANKILKETRGYGFTDKERKVANKIARQIVKESKKQNKILTADEAYELFINKPLNINITTPSEAISLEEYETNKAIDDELDRLRRENEFEKLKETE